MISLIQSIFANIGLFCFGILLLSLPIARFLDVWLLGTQRRRVREKFEEWWITVADLNKLTLALVIAKKFSTASDRFFGERLFSSRAFFKGLLVATGLLISSLALIGIVNHKIVGIQPWADYRQTALLINGISSNFVASIQNTNALLRTTQPSVSGTLAGQTTLSPYSNSVTSQKTLGTNQPWITATQSSHFSTTNLSISQTNLLSLSTNSQPSNPQADLQKQIADGMKGLVQITNRFNTPGWTLVYSIAFLSILIISNAILFYLVLTFSRLILREIIAAARLFSTIALLVTNFCFVLFVSTFFLLLLSILGIPLVWYIMPLVYQISQDSFGMLFLIVSAAGVAAWIFVSPVLKIVTLIAMLPSVLTLAVTVITGLAIAARNLLHKLVSAVLLRFAENGFLKITIAFCSLVVAIIAVVTELVHLFKFK